MNINKRTAAIISVVVVLLAAFAVYAFEFRDKCDGSKCETVNNNNQNSTSTSSSTPQNSTSSVQDASIRVTTPKPGDTISSPLTFEGEAKLWYFEADFPVRLLDGNGKEIAVSYATAQSDWMTTEFVPFKGSMQFATPTTETGTLVFEKANPSGLSQYDKDFRIPIKFNMSKKTISLDVFFGNSYRDPYVMNCDRTYSVKRVIPATQAVAKASIEELLKGPSPAEKDDGYFTSIKEGTRLNSVTLKDGVLTADFNSALDEKVGGSCLVSQIRSQIETTLKQFPGVRQVIITRNGSDMVLQP